MKMGQLFATTSSSGSQLLEDLRSPPWSSSPPQSSDPDSALLHSAKSTLDGRDTRVVAASSQFTQESLLLVRLEPGSSGSKPLCADGGRDTGWRGTGTVTVEVLMHLYIIVSFCDLICAEE